MSEALKCPKCGEKVVISTRRNSDVLSLKCMKLRWGCDYGKSTTQKALDDAGDDFKKLDPPLPREVS